MEHLMTVSEVSRTYGVSPRMLRHYEKLGLMDSMRKEDYAYRVYRPEDIRRLRQILVLRKLRVSLKEIGDILADSGSAAAVAVLEKNLAEMDGEILAMTTVRDVIREFLDALKQRRMLPAGEAILEDGRLMVLADSLAPSSTLIQEERKNVMERTEQPDLKAKALRDVRIVRIPACDVAAAHVMEDEPEAKAGSMIAEFVRKEKLWEKSPGLRLYGFNHPSPVDETGRHGYEFWVTLPEGVDVPAPLEKKHFPGGTYAAHMIQMGDFEEWAWLDEWVRNSDEYEYNGSGSPEDMFGCLEEHLNYHDHAIEAQDGEPQTAQLDLLIPVKRRAK